jgi:hypothetical protein
MNNNFTWSIILVLLNSNRLLYGLLVNKILRIVHNKYYIKSSHNRFYNNKVNNLVRRYDNNLNFDGNCLNFNNSDSIEQQPKQLYHLNEIDALISDSNDRITENITTTISTSSNNSSYNSSNTMIKPTIFSLKQLSLKLSQTGQSGLLAYGILNCLYYTSMTAIVWIYQSKSVIIPSASSSSSSSILLFTSIIKKTILKLSKIILIVWAGSQITKVFRLFLSIALAPFIDNVIEYVLSKYEIFKITNRNHVIYFIITLLWLFTLSFYFILIFSSSFIELLT